VAHRRDQSQVVIDRHGTKAEHLLGWVRVAASRRAAPGFSESEAAPVSSPWVHVLFLIRSITSTTWGHEAFAREGWWN
jgi:hypothetical protein